MAEAIGVGEHEVEVVESTKNEYEYRAELLSALFNSLQGEEVSFPASMVKDTEVYRKGILNALNVEYTDDDVKHTPVFRSKVIDGVKNMSGGGEVPTVTFKVINNAGFKVLMYGAYEEWGEVNIRQDLPIGFNGNVTLIASSTGQTNCVFIPQSSSANITTSATGSADSTTANGYRISGSDAVITITAV